MVFSPQEIYDMLILCCIILHLGRGAHLKLKMAASKLYFNLLLVLVLKRLGLGLREGMFLTELVSKHALLHAGIALVASVLNFVTEPIGTKVLFERYELEKSGGQDKEKIKSLKKEVWSFPWAL